MSAAQFANRRNSDVQKPPVAALARDPHIARNGDYYFNARYDRAAPYAVPPHAQPLHYLDGAQLMGSVVGILLAGGAARRFGANKLLAHTSAGVPIGIQAARSFVGAVAELIVVVPPGGSGTREMFAQAFSVATCPDAHRGIGHSIAYGVASRRDADGWLIGLADMPYISAALIKCVADAVNSPRTIARPRYREQAGHPVGFGSHYGNELEALTGDSGAQKIICAHLQSLTLIDTEHEGVVRDVDRPEDIA